MNEKKKTGTASIVAVACGAAGLISPVVPVLRHFGFVLAVLGIVFGAIGMKKAKLGEDSLGLSTAGLVMGIVGCFGAILGIIARSCLSCIACSLLTGAAG